MTVIHVFQGFYAWHNDCNAGFMDESQRRKIKYTIWDIETGPNAVHKSFRPIFAYPEGVTRDMIPKGMKNWFKRDGERSVPKTHKKLETQMEWVKEQMSEWKDKLALNVTTAEILAIGVGNEAGISVLTHNTEKQLLETFWGIVSKDHWDPNCRYVGFYSVSFDLQMLIGRSQIHGLEVPIWAHDPWQGQRSQFWWDIQSFLPKGLSGTSLNKTLRIFDLPGKTGEGKDFAKDYRAGGERREKAIQYLIRDIEVTQMLAKRVLPRP